MNKFRKENDLVSVLMCVYNTPAEYLNEAITSILNQTYKNIELIIIDDHTEEADVVRYLAQIGDDRVHIYRNEKNIGLTRSLNKGLIYCKGQYIARMDSDDVANKNRIAEQLYYMKRKGCAIAGCNWKAFPLYNHHPLSTCDTRGFRVAQMFGNLGPGHSTFFIDRKQLIELDLKYDEKYRTSQDYALLCDCICKGGIIGVLNKTLIGWRRHGNQISILNKAQQDKDANRIRESYISRMFNMSSYETRVFVENIHGDTYRNAMDSSIELILYDFMKKNSGGIIDKEVHKYWFFQGLKRFKYIHRKDFIRTKLFLECLRIDRLVYIVFYSVLERIHYLYQPFIRV